MTVPTNSVLCCHVKPKPTTSCGKLFTWLLPTRGTESESRDLRRNHGGNCSINVHKVGKMIRARHPTSHSRDNAQFTTERAGFVLPVGYGARGVTTRK